jgi:hypothetical protein
LPSFSSGFAIGDSIGRGGPTRLGIGGVDDGDLQQISELAGHLLAAVIAGDGAPETIEPVEQREGDRLDGLHPVAAEPRQGADAIHRPGHQVARAGEVVLLLRDEARALDDGGVAGRRDADAALVGGDPELSRGQREAHLRRWRVELEGASRDPRALPGFLQVGEGLLEDGQARPAGGFGAAHATEIRELDAVDAVVTDRPGEATIRDHQVALVHRGGVGDVEGASESSQPPLGRELRVDEEDVRGLALAVGADDRPAPGEGRAPEAPGRVEPGHLLRRAAEPLVREGAHQRRREVGLRARRQRRVRPDEEPHRHQPG